MAKSDEVSNADIFLYALYKLGGAGDYVDIEDAFMEMWKLTPARFRWRKYDQPNYKIMFKALVDVSHRSKPSPVMGSRHSRQLTASGVEWVEKHLDRFKALEAGKLAAPPDRRPSQKLVVELSRNLLVQRFLRGEPIQFERPQVAIELLQCSPDAPRSVWRERLETLRSGAADGGRGDLLDFLNHLENEKHEWFTELKS